MSAAAEDTSETEIARLFTSIVDHSPSEAMTMLSPYPDSFVTRILELLNPAVRQDVLARFTPARRAAVLGAGSIENGQQWIRNEAYPEHSVGRLMEPALAVYSPAATVAEAVEHLRHQVKKAVITYAFVVDADHKLVGVVTMRELLLAAASDRLEDIMVRQPFSLTSALSVVDAMRAVLMRHYPAYPVCDRDGRLLGIVRGQMMFEAQTFELSAQPGAMVGVEKEERLATKWPRSLRLRQPWLQVNLFTGFIAGAVVGYFEGTIDRLVVLAAFVPVLISQAANTGLQTLAIALRAITLGELDAVQARRMAIKETLLGGLNGALTGVSAGAGMFAYASIQKNPAALTLGLVVFLAMTISCLVSGVIGATTPLLLRRLGADPATASSIVLTTVTDVVSMAIFLGLATVMV